MNKNATKLISNELKIVFKWIGEQNDEQDPMVLAKFFNPEGAGTWYAVSYDETDNICFGYVTGLYMDELGTFSISELESLKLPFGNHIERDLYFTPCRLSKITEKPS